MKGVGLFIIFHIAGDKRQFTVVPAVSAAGELILPAQTIWAGKTNACHPKENDFPKELYHDHSESHWSTVETMKNLITNLMETYFIPKRESLGLPADQHMILMLDVYSAHRDSELLMP